MGSFEAYTVTCAAGTADVLAGELRALGLEPERESPAAVGFRGTREDALRCCLHLRTAHRVLRRIGRFPAPDAEALYRGAAAVDWERYLTPRHTLAVEAHGTHGDLRNSRFVALKIKDAVVDVLRDRCGERPDVDVREPDLRLVARLQRGRCELSLDLAGDSLHRRGYRSEGARAPLRETLAAAMLLLAGYDGGQALVDPLCGSGTLVVEGAWIALNRAPALGRSLGVERWHDGDGQWRQHLERLRQEARQAEQAGTSQPILAGDRDARAIRAARSCAERAGVDRHIRFQRCDLQELEIPADDVLLVANPPYGRRLGRRDDDAVYRALGELLRRIPRGRAMVLVPDRRREQALGLRPVWRRRLRNGPLRIWLNSYRIG